MSQVNIEEIMDEIRRSIAEKGYKNLPVEFDAIVVNRDEIESNQFESGGLHDEINYLNANWMNSWNVSIHTNKILIRLICKIIRKLTRFIVIPIVNHQNEYNASVARCFNHINEYTTMYNYEERIADLENQLKLLRKQIENGNT